MTTKEQVLTILLRHHGEWQSGDQLAQSVGCSRESIWKAINALRKQGHQIESRKTGVTVIWEVVIWMPKPFKSMGNVNLRGPLKWSLRRRPLRF